MSGRRRWLALASCALAAAVLVSGAPAVAQTAPATASVSGLVTATEGGAPLAGVCVRIIVFDDDGVTERTVTTDGAGRYSITGLAAGFALVSFNTCASPLAGFASEFYFERRGFGDADEIEIDPGEQVTAINASLEREARITGRVTSAGSGLAGIRVVAFDDGSGASGTATTAADGSYSIATLPVGRYFVLFFDDTAPLTFVGEVYNDRSPFDEGVQPDLVAVAVGQTATGIDASLEEGGSLAGRVTAEHTGADVAFCDVVPLLGGDPVEPRGFATTGFDDSTGAFRNDGRFVIGGVPVGEYVIEFDCTVGYELEYSGDVVDPARAARVRVVRGQEVAGLDAVVRPVPTIEVTCSLAEEVGAPVGFNDVAFDNVHAEAIDCVSALGVARGRDDGTFGPALPVQRDQLASFVARALDAAGVALPPRPADRFGDDNSSIHELSINQLAELGIVSGVAPGRFAPGQRVTREQMATIIVGAYQKATGLTLRSTGNRFSDDAGSVHEGNIDKVAAAAITTGRTPTTFDPGANVRRDQLATFLARLIDRVLIDTPVDPAQFGPGGGGRFFGRSGERVAPRGLPPRR